MLDASFTLGVLWLVSREDLGHLDEREVDDGLLSDAFWYTLAVAVALVGAVWFASPALASVWDNAALVPLIRSFTLQGETILDPFAGSGSTCAAAALTGRKYIGVEMDDTYFQHSTDRLNRVHRRIAAKRSSGVGIPTRV